ncbi:Uncharacterised protein [Vibrio cholerae]|nr:Uncharacterised protein [Vibrio cholerae]
MDAQSVTDDRGELSYQRSTHRLALGRALFHESPD